MNHYHYYQYLLVYCCWLLHWKALYNNNSVAFWMVSAELDSGWVDPDTPIDARYIDALTETDHRQYTLVFSDEFEQDGRTFHDGSDPRWTAINKNDYTNDALQFYSHDNAFTSNGVLNITTEQKVNLYKAFDEDKKQFYADKKYIQSGMLQSWNKFCFTGGIIEFSAKLPGEARKGGLWPALWMLGNLARATYVGSSDYVWPFSYNQCDQRNRLSQEINACSRVNHYGLESYRGRGSPEIDIIESMQGDSSRLPNTRITRPYQSASLQIAPGIEIGRPILGEKPKRGHWYDMLEYGNKSVTDLNPFFYGVTLVHKPKIYTYQSDALSANTQLNESHYRKQHLYRVEWDPPGEDGKGGYIRWYTDNNFIYGIKGASLDIMKTEIPSEPMYMLMNVAVSSNWGFPAPCPEGCECDCFECDNPSCLCALPQGYCSNFPSSFEIDYVRVYQAENEPKHTLGCSPENRPTAKFIEGHQDRYTTSGQRHSLLPVITGGGSCITDDDCGGRKRGMCSSSGSCLCVKGATGPNCLAHATTNKFDTRKPKPFLYHRVVFPSSLKIIAILLVVIFIAFVIYAARKKSKEPKYYKLQPNGYNDPSYHHTNASTIASYQNSSAGSLYALPPTEKVVTYCVIDGRLVDNS